MDGQELPAAFRTESRPAAPVFQAGSNAAPGSGAVAGATAAPGAQAGPWASPAASVAPDVAAIAKALRKKAQRMALVGFLWLAAGLAISIGSYLAAGPGESYTVMWGAAVFGAYKCIRGLYFMADPAKLLPPR